MNIINLFLVLYNEIRMSLALNMRYKFNNIMRLIIMTLKFIGFSIFAFNGALNSPELPSTLLGYLVWFFSFFPLFDMGFNLREAMQEGTLEQIFMSPVPAWFIIIGRMIATLLFTAIQGLGVLLLVGLILNVWIPFNVSALIIFMFIFVGIMGLSFMIGAITLLTKRTESLSMLCSNVLLFLSGAISPVDHLPMILQKFSYFLPTTAGIIVLRQAAIEGRSLIDLWQHSVLVQHLAISCTYFAVGLCMFIVCTRMVKDRGTLGQY